MSVHFKNIFFDTSKNKFVVKFSYDAKIVESIKAAIDYKFRTYNIEKKEWYVSKDCSKILHDWGSLLGFNIAGTALAKMQDVPDAKVKAFEIPEMPEGNINIPLKMEPYHYQKQGIAYNLTHDNVLIGDPPGVGKTIQAIATVLALDLFPCLIISPNHLKLNWKQEVEKWTNKRAVLITDKVKKHGSQYFDTGYVQYGIVNYESLPKYFVQEMKRSEITNKVLDIELNGFEKHFRSIVWDESHTCSNTKTQRYKISKAISKSKDIKKRLALTGTPIKNKLTELMNQLSLIDALGPFGGTKGFSSRFIGFEKTKFGSKENPQNLEELQYLMRKNCYYRREKHEVLKELPDKFRQIIKVEIDNRREYDEALVNFKKYLEEKRRFNSAEIEKSMRAEILVQMMYLIQISARGKMKAIKDFIEDMNEQGEKVVTFCHHKAVRDSFMEKFPTAVQIAGGMTIEEKDASVKGFQTNDEIMNIIVSMKAGSTGITLTASSKVVSVELPWTPDVLEQCEDRCVAKGQLIMTRNGYKKIEDVVKGDLVYTDKGNWKPVLDTWSKYEKQKAFTSIKYKGFSEPLVVTTDHRIYVYDKTKKSFYYEEASKLDIINHQLVFVNPVLPSDQIETIKIARKYGLEYNHRNGTKMKNARVKNPLEEVVLTNDLMYAFGWYLAEGWFTIAKTNEKGSIVSICGNATTEPEKVKSIAEIFIREFGLKDSKVGIEINKKNCISAMIYSKNLASFFSDMFGNGSENKRIPDFVYKTSQELRNSFLKGYYEGDGYERKNTQQASTASSKIAIGLCELEAGNGNPITLRVASWGGWSFEYSIRDKTTRRTLIENKHNCILFPIEEFKTKRPDRANSTVYDLTVKDDESFVVGLATVHNCHRIGAKDSVNAYYFLGVDTIDEKMYDIINQKRMLSKSALGINEKVETQVHGSNDIFSELLKMF